jgi:hypothetical protein
LSPFEEASLDRAGKTCLCHGLFLVWKESEWIGFRALISKKPKRGNLALLLPKNNQHRNAGKETLQ